MTRTAASGPYPRSISAREAEILQYLLSVDDDRLAPPRVQAPTAYVIGMCTCGCATIDLAVDRDRTQPAALCSQVVSADTGVVAGAPVFGLLLFLDEGWLSQLEIWWIDAPPPEFPPVTAFGPPRFDRDT